MSTTTDALQRAIDYLHATEVAPGRYAWRDEERGCWCVTASSDLLYLDELLRRPDGSYRMWRSLSCAFPTPSWWTPERRFAFRHIKTREVVDYSAALERAYYDDESFERITADLNTGEEIPA